MDTVTENSHLQMTQYWKSQMVCDSNSPPAGLQSKAEDATLKWYKELQASAAQCAQSFEQLNAPKDNQVG